jgi:transmembrane sensor
MAHANPASIDEAAADWLLRELDGLSPDELVQRDRWLAGHPGHGAALARLRQAWTAVGDLADDPQVVDMRAAALETTAPATAPATPAPPPRGPARRGWLPWAAAASFALAFAAGGWIMLHPATPAPLELVAGQGSPREFALADGSKVTLDAASRLAVTMDAGERHLRLEGGQAYFVVAHDAARPFVVEAGGRAVVALGTEFGVRQEQGVVTVALTQGRVRVGPADAGAAGLRPDTGAAGTELSPGQTLTFDPATGLATIARQQADAATDWRRGLLRFDHTPLASVIADFNRYGPDRLVLADPALGTLPVSGQFRSDNQAGLLRALPLLFPLKVARGADGTVSIGPAAPEK